MESKYTVYCHTHIESGRRYIGITKHTMMHRWNQHCSQAKNSKNGRWHFPNAIRKYGKDAFEHKIIGVYDSLEEANRIERNKIEEWDLCNPEKGFNLAPGGEHKPHPIRKNPWNNPEYREKQLPRLVAATHTPEALAKMKATISTPEFKARQSQISKEILSRPEVKAKESTAARARWLDLEYREKCSKNWKNMTDPEIRERARVASNTPESIAKRHTAEVRAKMRISCIGKKHTDEAKLKVSRAVKGRKYNRTLEEQARMNAALSASWTPEKRSKMAAISTTHKGKKFSAEELERISAGLRKYVVMDGKITHKICQKHGLIPVECCVVKKGKKEKPEVLCKQCNDDYKKAYHKSHYVKRDRNLSDRTRIGE